MVSHIYLANIYFTDASASKVRPVLLLKSNSCNDVLYTPLTSNTNIRGVRIDNSDLENGYLPKTSIVVFEKPGVISIDLLVKKIGTLTPEKYKEVIDELIKFLKPGNEP
ncbi:MAG: hypothetical protein JWR18_2231 [Segetibacter sp.]|nr:hypothetical protein [Segetibacter sp.]